MNAKIKDKFYLGMLYGTALPLLSYVFGDMIQGKFQHYIRPNFFYILCIAINVIIFRFAIKAEKDNLVFGSGKNVHGHGTTQDLVKFKPKPFHLSLSSPNALQNGGSSLKTLIADQAIKNNAPPTSNPEKSQTNNLNSKSNTSNVTIHQEFKTDMTINGATSPVDSANAVKRQQDNSLVIMARGVKGLMP